VSRDMPERLHPQSGNGRSRTVRERLKLADCCPTRLAEPDPLRSNRLPQSGHMVDCCDARDTVSLRGVLGATHYRLLTR